MSPGRINRAFSGRTSMFNPFPHEKERSVAYLRQATVESLAEGRMVLPGAAGLIVRRAGFRLPLLVKIAAEEY